MMSGDMVSRLIALLDMERKAHRETRRKLEKAAHDRERYARRIRFLQGRHVLLAQDYHALQLENQILRTAVNSLERVLQNEPRTETRSEESAERTAQTEAPAVSADDQGAAHGRAGQERYYDKRP